jgi:hypothetical protein
LGTATTIKTRSLPLSRLVVVRHLHRIAAPPRREARELAQDRGDRSKKGKVFFRLIDMFEPSPKS